MKGRVMYMALLMFISAKNKGDYYMAEKRLCAAVTGIIIAVVAFRYFGTQGMQASKGKRQNIRKKSMRKRGMRRGKSCQAPRRYLQRVRIAVKEAGQGKLTIQLNCPVR